MQKHGRLVVWIVDTLDLLLITSYTFFLFRYYPPFTTIFVTKYLSWESDDEGNHERRMSLEIRERYIYF